MSMDQIIKANLEKFSKDITDVCAKATNNWYSRDEGKKVNLELSLSKEEWLKYFHRYMGKFQDLMIKNLIRTEPGTRGDRLVLEHVDMVCEKSARKAGFGIANINGRSISNLKPTTRQSKNGVFIGESSCDRYLDRCFSIVDEDMAISQVRFTHYRTSEREYLMAYLKNIYHYTLVNGRTYRNNEEVHENVKNMYMALYEVVLKAWRRARGTYLKSLVKWMDSIGIKEAFGLACRVWGQNVTVWEINRIADNYETLKKLKEESPRILIHALRMAPFLGVSKMELSFLGSVKTSLHELGLTKGAWKLMDRMPAFYMRDYLAGILTSGKNDNTRKTKLNFFVNSLTWSSQAQINDELLFKWMRACDAAWKESSYQSPYQNLPQVLWKGLPSMQVSTVEEATAFINDYNAKMERLPLMFRAAVEGFRDCADMEQYQARWGQVSDFLSRSEVGTWQALPEKLTWAILWKRQADWHEAITAQEKAENNRYSWTSLVTKLEEDEWVAESLDDGGALWEEGKSMHHCVSSYAHYCRSGNTRIYSIKKNGDRYATLQIERTGAASWKNVQIRGYCNAAIKNPFVLNFADSIATAYSEAERKEMDEANKKAKKAA